MKTTELLSRLKDLRVRLWVEGGELKVSAPRGALTPELKDELSARKAELAALVAPAVPLEQRAIPRALRGPGGGRLPLSFTQQRLWFLEQLEPGNSAYNMWVAIVLRGDLDVAALERAVAEIVRRHDALRTSFPDEGGLPYQRVAPPGELRLELVADERGLPEAEWREEVRRLLRERGQHVFDLAAGPLFLPTLVRVHAREHVLFLLTHHMVFDGLSKAVLARELQALYPAFAAGLPSPLPELQVQYADYAAWQRRLFEGPELERQLAYWRATLAGELPVLELPADRPRPPVPTHRGAAEWREVPPELVARLEALGQREGATLFSVLLAAYDVLLHRTTGLEDVLVGTAVANRGRAELEGLIGDFVNTLVLRADLSGDPSFRTLLRRVRDATLGALEHQEMPFEKLVDELQPERRLGHTPIFQTMFVLDEDTGESRRMGSFELEQYDMGIPVARMDLILSALRDRKGFWIWVEYDTDLFDRATIVRLQDHFLTLLAGIAADPDARLSALPLLGATEREQVLEAWNDARPGQPQVTVHERFEQQADRTPDAVALLVPAGEDGTDPDGGEALTYAELDARANRLARHLIDGGVRPGDLVGLCVERSADMVAALLGILKAGAAYVPLDPGFPPERLAYMVADAGLQVVVGQSALRELVPPGPRLVLLDAEAAAIEARSSARPGVARDPRARAYVIYTSGSTGRPKGVEIEHRSVSSFLTSMAREPGLRAGERLLAITTLSFDISVLELLLPLVVGGTAVVAPRAVAAEGDRLRRLLERARPDAMQATPATWRLLLLAGWRGDPGLRVLCGGEALTRELADQLLARCGELWNVYGPTEATVWATARRIEPGAGPITIGRPIDATRAYVLDAHLRPVPIGVPGELFLGGDGLARGYLGRAALTAERFLPDPYARVPGARMYRTGDLARWRAEGELECLGRTDHQVKVRGFRIELGEIDAVLEEHALVHQCATVVREDAPGDRRLVAYLVPEAGARPGAGELREHARSRLPAYMLPAGFVLLDALPLTPNGKVDRRALLQQRALRPAAETAFVAPRDETEERVAAIWREVLGVERVGVHDDFFELGGNSLLSAQVAARIRAGGVELPLRLIFEEPTVAALARHVAAAGGAQRPASIPRLAREGPAPLSFAQQRLWFLDQLEPGRSTYNMWIARSLSGPLDAPALERAVAEIVRRHEVLRSRFEVEDGIPVQVVDPPGTVRLVHVLDPERRPVAEWREEVRRWLHARVGEPFDLAHGPLLRAWLVRVAPEEHVLLLVAHHTVIDGLSVGIVLRELQALYPAFAAGAPSPLPEPPIQYADYAAWQRELLDGPELERQMGYWRTRLAGELPVLALPADRPRPRVRGQHGAVERRRLPRALVDRLAEVAAGEGATLFMALVAAYQALLARVSGQDDVIVGTAVGNRGRPETEGMVGFLANTLALRTDLSGDPGFRELVRRVRETCLGALDHQEIPFERLVDELAPERDLGTTPIFQTLLTLEEDLGEAGRLGGLATGLVGLDVHVARTDLTLLTYLGTDGLSIVAEYDAALFDGATVARLLEGLETLARDAAAEPERPLSRLSILPEAERGTLLDSWSGAPSRYPRDSTIQAEFEARAAEAPDAVAAVFAPAAPGARPTTITYGELNARANRVAHHLIRLGVGPDQLVGLCTERTLPMLVGILGILKAGGAYLPLDPGYPAARLRGMVEDGRCALLLVQESLRASLPPLPGKVLPLDAEPDRFAAESDADPPVRSGPRSLAYAMFTSGSTGRPKGVCVEQRSVLRLVMDPSFARLGPEETLLHFAPISFDASTLEVWGALLRGGRMVVFPPTEPSLEELGSVLREHRVTTAWLTAGLFSLMVDQRLEDLRGLRQLLAGGDVLPQPQVARVTRELPELRLINGYGPTENTTFTCCHLVTGPPAGPVPIGRPVQDTRVYVLDPALEPVPIGVPGDLWAGGDGVARGYLGRPRATAERFLPDPFVGEPGARMYATGDLVRWRADGTLEFLGRRDGQVKVRGFRIELGEIETALGALPGVRECVAVVREDVPGDKRIVAYVVHEGEPPEAGVLREAMRARLPEYMVPAHFVALGTLPLSPNGKVDRARLPAPDPARDVAAEYAPPSNEVERRLASIWQDVLRVERVGVHDNFFELGGNSLLSTQAVSRIRKAFEVDLPLRELFQEPTVAGLARRVAPGAADEVERRRYEQVFDRSLIPLQPRGWRKPLFVVSGAHAHEDDFLRFVGQLLPHMGADQPIYGFKARGLDGVTEPHDSAEEMARDYVAELLEFQPQGPFLLVGNCVGGIVAYEMAQQLRARGHEVPLLALLDTTAPAEGYREFVDDYYRFWKLERFRRHFSALSALSPAAMVGYVATRLGRKARKVVPLSEEARRRNHVERVERQYSVVLSRYQPRPYDGPLTVVVNEELQTIVPAGGWEPYARGGLELHVVPGDHVTRLLQNGRVTAELLRAGIARAVDGEPAQPPARAVQSAAV